ncbi:MAG: hypothetical protein CL840_10810 [Crocinitomicaceae bacterium]|nr:hypothetical protein [Crocinitomicaceae bacterium]|tara:strand:+ start:22757 stop:23551 length:795 start_codon:yes stop_codon:yes gene_type:complete
MKLLLSIFFIGLVFQPQDFSSLNLLKEIEFKASFMRVDNFGKIYLVAGEEVKMFGKNGTYLSQNSNKLLGTINDLDVTSGLEISAFFKDQIQVVFLDNQLALRGQQISLDLLEFEQVSEVCTSHGNGLWLYDQVKMELIRIDKNNNHVASSGNLMQLLGYSPEPNYMREINNWLYVNDPEVGILVFDIFGSYYKTIPIKNVVEFQIKNKQVIYFSNPYLIKFDMTELEYDTVMKIDENPKQVLVSKNQLNVLYNNKLSIFNYVP